MTNRSQITRAVLVSLLLAVAATLVGGLSPAYSQDIPRHEYLRYMPLEYPRIVQQTPASEELHLYGDLDAPGYSDVSPRDGIDDRRAEILNALAVHFAPYLVRNTTSSPKDFKKFWPMESFGLLYLDTWNVAQSPAALLEGRTIDLHRLRDSPCKNVIDPADSLVTIAPEAENDDCGLIRVLEEFGPVNPKSARYTQSSVSPTLEEFTVLYFNFPGDSPETWKEEYIQPISLELPRSYDGFHKIFVHPFLVAEKDDKDETIGYQFILQYCFFYPFNDGGNNHEGDWEHINVLISPRSHVTEPLSHDQILTMLSLDPDDLDGRDPLVIKRIDYYFHQNVMVLDFSEPNVYLPADEWNRVVKSRTQENVNEKWIWEETRSRAYRNGEETQVNTHPICFIGADNKGLDQLMSMPGGTNRDSHGTYPFTGMYKNVGPAGATEQVTAQFDFQKYFTDTTQGLPERVERYDLPGRVEIIPDWERVYPLTLEDVEARRQWSWLLLPIRWGYPASESPFAGVVPHAETGNLAPVGPSFSTGWNHPGTSASFSLFQPNKYNTLFPLGLQDTFVNSWGFLNAPASLLTILPPLDFIWRVVLAPPRALLKHPDPVFFPKRDVPFRFFAGSGGISVEDVPDEFNALFLQEPIAFEWLERLIVSDSSFVLANEPISESTSSPIFGFYFFLGRKLTTYTTIRNSHSGLGFDFLGNPSQQVTELRGELNFWEVSGSIRYNLTSGNLIPYAELGYGWSWYRIEGVTTQKIGTDPAPVLLDDPNGPWVRGSVGRGRIPMAVPMPGRIYGQTPGTWVVAWSLLSSEVRPLHPRGSTLAFSQTPSSTTAVWGSRIRSFRGLSLKVEHVIFMSHASTSHFLVC